MLMVLNQLTLMQAKDLLLPRLNLITSNPLPLNLLLRDRQQPSQPLENPISQPSKSPIQFLLVHLLVLCNCINQCTGRADSVFLDGMVRVEEDVAVFKVVHRYGHGAFECRGLRIVLVYGAPATVPTCQTCSRS